MTQEEKLKVAEAGIKLKVAAAGMCLIRIGAEADAMIPCEEIEIRNDFSVEDVKAYIDQTINHAKAILESSQECARLLAEALEIEG